MMQEKILAKLKEQRGQNSQVSDKTLESMAKTWSSVIIDDETLGNIDFTEQISSLQGNIGHIAKQVKEDTEKLFKTAPVNTQNNTTTLPQKPDNLNDTDLQVLIAKAIKDAVNPLNEELAKMKGEKITNTRTQQINDLLKDAPEAYKKTVFAGFEKMNFSDDDDFTSFKETARTNFESFQQMAKEQGVTFPSSGANVQTPKNDGRDSVLSQASKVLADSKKE